MHGTHNKQWFAHMSLRVGECVGRCFSSFWVVILLLIVGFVIGKQIGNTGATPNTVTRNMGRSGVVRRQVSWHRRALVFLSSHEAVQIAITELERTPGLHFLMQNVSFLADKWNNVAGQALKLDPAMAGR